MVFEREKTAMFVQQLMAGCFCSITVVSFNAFDSMQCSAQLSYLMLNEIYDKFSMKN